MQGSNNEFGTADIVDVLVDKNVFNRGGGCVQASVKLEVKDIGRIL